MKLSQKSRMAGVPVKKTPEGIAESSQEEADRQAIERGEDDGMIVYQSVTSRVYISKES
jgi:hypothetical protein